MEGLGMFTHLLAEGRIGTLTLKNRMVMPPMGSFHTEADGSVGDELVAYYGARAEGGFGLIIQEYTCVSPEGLGGPKEPRLWSDDDIPGARRIVDAAHSGGARIVVQLHHAGRETT
jgi:2,4-dienoyl-CoA reductase-like NADH-dependent reductase (Old Yellow Enzyme family)